MAVLSRDEFFARIQARLGEDTSDEAMTFLEDMTDTFNDMSDRAQGDGVDWETKYHELDERWKQRYRHRFFNGGSDSRIPKADAAEPDGEESYEPNKVTVDSLFT